VSIEILPLQGVPEIRSGDDLAAVLESPLRELGPRGGDVVVVTSKAVSKAEGRLVAGTDRAPWVEREAVRVVARRGDLVIAETRHGFVCANAGVDTSNVDPGIIALLPEDSDLSAERLRSALEARLGVRPLGVVITDTFGRPWREGLVDVAIGLAGLPALVDLRGTPDDRGRLLEATVIALADQVAAASGLEMRKTARIPAVIARGLDAGKDPGGRARDLVRPAREDLFREAPLLSISARRTIRSFGPGDLPREAIEEAVVAACTAPAPHHTRPWRFTALLTPPAKRTLLATIAEAWREDLRGDGTSEEVIDRRIGRSDAVLGTAPALIVPWVRFRGAHPYADPERAHAEREMFLLSAGAGIQNLLLALHAQGFASCWISSTLFCQEETRAVLGMDDEWFALGTVAAGPMPQDGAPSPRPTIDLAEVLAWR
jgi:dehydro coenzyme F420 reductase / coenzyme F420-0:L-glutamate ligase / coenzyme F420-1:gamma-L-glutamate ligase